MAQPLAFDSASVRTSAQAENEDPHVQTSPGSLTIRGMSLKFCIQWAYGLLPSQIEGPAWLKDVGLDNVAKAGQSVGNERLRSMLRTLLAEPFSLKVHREEKEEQVYAVTVAKGGPKFQESDNARSAVSRQRQRRRNGGATDFDGRIGARNFKSLNRPVVDATGLKGRYDFRIDTPPYVTAAAEANGVKEEQLSVMDMTTILITDHAEIVPSDN